MKSPVLDLEPAMHTYSLPGLLPEYMRLSLDAQAHIALLWQQGEEDGALSRVHVLSLTPAATRVFHALLQAAPQHCSHRTLFAALFPDQRPGAEQHWNQALAIRPIRRALVSLLPVVRACGLQVISLRGCGYVLVAASTHATQVQVTSRTPARGDD